MLTFDIAMITSGRPSDQLLERSLNAALCVGAALRPRKCPLGPDSAGAELFPPGLLEDLRAHDAILCSSADLDSVVPAPRGALIALREALGLTVNVRELTGVGGYAHARFAVVRETSGGAYAGPGWAVGRGTGDEVATQVSVETYSAAERCVRIAFELARRRQRRVVLAHKPRLLTAAGALWQRALAEVAAQQPDIAASTENIDDCCGRLVEHPASYDVIVTDNVFGDIVSDVACSVARARPYTASAELALPGGPFLFEPMHGPAADGGVPRPLAAVAAVAAMLDALGAKAQGAALSRAVLSAAAAGADGEAFACIDRLGADAARILGGTPSAERATPESREG